MSVIRIKKKININLNRDELVEVLLSKISNKIDDNRLFEGQVNSNGNFILYPKFDYSARNLIRPQIKGYLHEISENNNVVELEFDLPKEWLIGIYIAILFNIIIVFILFFYEIFPYSWCFLLGCIVYFLLTTYIFYTDKVEKSLYHIKAYLK